MGTQLSLTASDGFKLGAWRADPPGSPKGGLVVIQEIFGVNHHIRAVCDRFAERGYAAIAPAIFDRITPGFESGYTPEDIEHARAFIPKLDWAAVMLDVQAAAANVANVGRVGIVGYCLGGSVAYNAGCELDNLTCAIGYYGGQIAKNADRKPRVPTLLHFGDQDAAIPMSDVDTIKLKRPEIDIYVYRAGHGFSCDERGSYNEAAHNEALGRTLDWLGKYVD